MSSWNYYKILTESFISICKYLPSAHKEMCFVNTGLFKNKILWTIQRAISFFIENSNIVFSILNINIEMHVVFCVVKMGILT